MQSVNLQSVGNGSPTIPRPRLALVLGSILFGLLMLLIVSSTLASEDEEPGGAAATEQDQPHRSIDRADTIADLSTETTIVATTYGDLRRMDTADTISALQEAARQGDSDQTRNPPARLPRH